MLDITTLPPLEKTIDRCKVISLGTGAVPKNITVQLPGQDGAQVAARWTGTPPLAVNDYCRVLRVNSDTVKYLIVSTSAGTGVVCAKNNFSATTNPGVGDDSSDGYSVGSIWVNVTLDTVWTCADATAGAAVWISGGAEIASDAEVTAGTNDTKIVTPLKLKTRIETIDAAKVSKLAASDTDPDPAFSTDVVGNATGVGWLASDAQAFRIKNTSGGTVYEYYVGYISELGEFKTTTTEAYNGAWCVVVKGGDNNADIYVARRGRVVVNYAGTAPTAGDYLITSTTAGSAKTNGTNMRPEVFAVAVANGSSGIVTALLLTQTQYIPLTSTNDIFRISATSDSNFTGTISSVSANTLVYTVTGGTNEDSISPFATTNLAKIRLYNSTRNEYLLISANNTGTNTTTFTENVPAGWVATDVITPRSPTNNLITVGGGYYYELEFASEVPALTRAIEIGLFMSDTGGAGATGAVHPYEASSSPKQTSVITQSTSGINSMVNTSLINKRFTMLWDATGTATLSIIARLRGVYVAAP